MKKFIPFILVVFTACASLKPVAVEYIMAPEDVFPYLDSDLLIVNCAKEKLPENSLFVLSDSTFKSVKYDKVAVNESYVNILAEKIENSNMLGNINIYNYNMISDTKRLTKSQLDTIYNDTGLDLILTLNDLDHKSVVYNIENNPYVVTHQMIIRTNFSLYLYPDTTPIWNSIKSDTLFWNGYAFSEKEFLKAVPPINDCIYDACYISAERCVPYWFPVKEKFTRYFMDYSNPAIKEAYDYYTKGDKEACEIMLDYALDNSKNKKVKQISYYNKAVIADENGNYDLALKYLKSCMEVDEEKKFLSIVSLEEYMDILKKRVEAN